MRSAWVAPWHDADESLSILPGQAPPRAWRAAGASDQRLQCINGRGRRAGGVRGPIPSRRWARAVVGQPQPAVATPDVMLHCATRIYLADLACISLGEYLIHGYDVATTVDRPWPVLPHHAALALHGYLPFYRLIANPQTTSGLSAALQSEPRGGDEFTVHFTDGT